MASVTPFISKLDSPRDLIILMVSSISLFEIINAAFRDPEFFFLNKCICCCIPAVNPNGIKMRLVNGVSTFFINGKLAVINGLRKLTNRHS